MKDMFNPPRVLFPEMTALIDLDEKEVQSNVHSANARGLPEALRPHTHDDLSRTVALIGGGPSMKEADPKAENGETFLQLLEKDDSVLKVACGSACNHTRAGLLSKVDVGVFNLPDPKGVDEKTGVRYSYGDHFDTVPGMRYLLASQCDPRVFDKIENGGGKIEVFHSAREGIDFGSQTRQVGAGSTAPAAALAVMAAKGYKNFVFYGVDGGSKMDPEKARQAIAGAEKAGRDGYAYDMPDDRIADNTIIIEVGGEYYATTKNFWEQQQEMVAFADAHPEVKMDFKGNDRLSGALLNHPRPQSYQVYDLSKLRTPDNQLSRDLRGGPAGSN